MGPRVLPRFLFSPGEDLFGAVNIGPLMEMHNNALESDHSLKSHYSVASSTVLSLGHAWLRPRRRKECIIYDVVQTGGDAFGWANASRFKCSASSFLMLILDNASSGPLYCSFKRTSDGLFRRKLGALRNIGMEEYAVEPWWSQRSQQTWQSAKLLHIGKKASISTLSARQIFIVRNENKLSNSDKTGGWPTNRMINYVHIKLNKVMVLCTTYTVNNEQVRKPCVKLTARFVTHIRLSR